MATPQQSISQPTQKLDTALLCLVTISKLLGIPADEEQLRRAYAIGNAGMDATNLLRAAKDLGLKSRLITSEPEKLAKLTLPAIAVLENGNYVVLLRYDENKVFLFDPYKDKPFAVPVDNFVEAWSGQLVLVTKRFSLKDAGKQFNIAWFIPVFLRYKRFFGEVILASFFLQLFALVSPLFTQVIIDKVLVHRGLSTLDILAVGLLIIALFEAWLGILRTYLFAHTTNKVDVILGTKLFHHITALPLRYFETRRVGDTVARVRELENIRQFMTGSALTVVLDTFFTVVFIAVMFFYSATLTVIALLALPAYILLSVIVTPMYRERLNEKFAAGAENQAYLVESVTGIQTVKSMSIEPNCNSKWEQLLARYVKTSFDTVNLSNTSGNISRFIQKVSVLAILWFGAHMVMASKLTVGQLIAFQMLSGQVSAPVLRLVNLWQSFQQTQLSIERLGDILNYPPEPAFNPNRTTLPAIRGEVILEGVTFRYRQDTSEVLRQVNLHLQPGMRVGIVGRSGSGKSTLTKLIQRLYVPESGRVMIDGVDLAQVEPAWLRRQIGVVLQESFLFSGSIRENIAIARPGASMDDVVKVAKIAGAHDFILEQSEGYDTNVGERGASLSGGQRQRIAIARALMTNPRLLIFDEATSALDYESEHIIQENLDQICEGRTVIIIAHRLSAVRNCHKIVVLDRGQVIEQGNHEKLLGEQGLYHSLYMKQEV